MAHETDPYRPPHSEVSRDDDAESLEFASKGRRFGTFMIDCIGVFAFAFLFAIVITIAFGKEGFAAIHRIPDLVLGNLLFFCYYVFFEGIWARTPGKLVFGTFVVNDTGGTPSFGRVIIRTLCRLIPFEPFSFLGERGWHDSISSTRVVRRKP